MKGIALYNVNHCEYIYTNFNGIFAFVYQLEDLKDDYLM